MNNSSKTVVTRFAPSPTGFLHIGGARTALFNWLLARKFGGQYLLRIEDTDRERSTDEAINAILEGLEWLGLGADDAASFQFARQDRHREIVDALLASGNAYRCYTSAEELAEMREAAEAAGLPPVYDGRWRDRDLSEAPSDQSPSIRLKAPRTGQTVVNDQVQGIVTFENENLDDLIILRSDGTPTYNLAVVVDDHDMNISHVLRGVDHLINAARQTQIYNALGWEVPVFAHVPLIHGPDGKKLSKRHGALGVEAYQAMGYLPDAVKNYLVRLGWSHGDQEIFSEAEMIEAFGFDGLGKSPSRFDFDKLDDINAHCIRHTDPAVLMTHIDALFDILDDGVEIRRRFMDVGMERFEALIPALVERAKTLVDLIDGAKFLTAQRPLSFDDKASKVLTDEARARLAPLAARLSELDVWDTQSIEKAIRDYIHDADLKLGKVGPALRAALTGTNISPPIFDVLAALPKNEAIERIRDVI